MRTSPSKCRFLLIAACATLTGAWSAAQIVSSQSPFGISPGGTYANYNIDTVNMLNGNVVIKIPLYSLPQLGKLALGFSAISNNTAWESEQYCDSGLDECTYFYISPRPNEVAPLQGYYNNLDVDPGPVIVNDNIPSIAGPYFSEATQPDNGEVLSTANFLVHEPDGASHLLLYDATNYSELRTTDGSGYLFNTGVPDPYYEYASATATLVAPNGVTTSSTSSNEITTTTQTDPAVPQHPITYTDDAATAGSGIYTDTLDRRIPDPSTGTTFSSSTQGCPAPIGDNQPTIGSATWTVPGPNGANLTYLICYASVNIHTDFWQSQGQNYYYESIDSLDNTWENEDEETVGSTNAIQAIVLPDGAGYWEFTYESADTNASQSDSYPYIAYGKLTKIRRPQGGTISYAYQTTNVCLTSGSPITWGLQSRTVSDANGHSSTWSYRFGVGNTSNVVTDPNGNDTVYVLLNSTDICPNYVKETTTYQGSMGSSTPLESTQLSNTIVEAPYTSLGSGIGGDANVLLTSSTTNLNDSVATTTATGYDSGSFTAAAPSCAFGEGLPLNGPTCNNIDPGQTVSLSMSFPTSSTVTDYSGTTLKQTQTQYAWQATGSPYWTANVLDTPATVTVYGSGGTQQAQTTLTYDQNDSCGGPVKGRLTTTSRWVGAGASVQSHQEWNCANGKVSEQTDANGNMTSISYDAAGLFPSTVTQPATNGVQHIDQYTWDDNTGNMLSHIDRSGTTSKFTYDSLGRVTLIDSAVGSSSEREIAYSYPSPTEIDVAADQTITGDRNLKSSTFYDGLGRVVQMQLTSDPGGTDYVDTVYDGFGRVASVSNPYRSTSNPTYGVTQYSYDALGRMIEELQPDGSTLLWCYDGLANASVSACPANASSLSSSFWVNSWDENKNHWQRTSDALGRLTSVIAPNAAETDYTYDALNNLTSAQQKGISPEQPRVRSFFYDGLSRLVSATNPESGGVGYTYDGNGNVHTKTSPAVNAPSGTQTVGYCYDALNRMTYKFYSGSFNCTSPAGFVASYSYDVSSVPGAQNTVGRLTDEKSYAGGTLVSERQPYSYDPMGRLLNENQYTLASLAKSQPYPVAFRYDLAGNLTASTDGVTPPQTAYTPPACPGQSGTPAAWSTLTFARCYDAAGHLLGVTANWSDPTHPPGIFSGATYAAPGGLTGASLAVPASGSPALNLSRTYDNRLRVNSETDTKSGGS